jgi:hypothetical protein
MDQYTVIVRHSRAHGSPQRLVRTQADSPRRTEARNQWLWFWIPASQAVAEPTFCHPEFISGSHNLLILLDAETSSA